MLESFKSYNQSHDLFSENENILLAISGGIDSVALLHLFLEINQPIGLAHCNFQLRGAESDRDEAFVKHLSEKYKLPLWTVHFDTTAEAEKRGISIQMAARDLRYAWFEKIRAENRFSKIAIAHNKNDVVETFLINLTRGSGLNGLSGIKAKHNNIIRPLLFAERSEIVEYIKQNNIDYHEDSSNASTKYMRNFIRHNIIPAFESLNPSFLTTITTTANDLHNISLFLNDSLQTIKNRIIENNDNTVTIQIKDIEQSPYYTLILHHLLAEYGFNRSQIDDISQTNSSGKQFQSSSFLLITHHDKLLISPLDSLPANDSLLITPEMSAIETPIACDFQKIEKTPEFKIPQSSDIAILDYDKLSFPLRIQHWQEGDFFYPLGMDKRKKLSDFFVDTKMSILEKKRCLLLTTANNEIVWVIGKRIDNRFRITTQTKTIYQIFLREN